MKGKTLPALVPVLLLSFLFAPGIALAQNDTVSLSAHPAFNSWALGLQAGSPGPGIVVATQINHAWIFRVGGTYLPVNPQIESPFRDSEMETKIKAGSASLIANWYPGGDNTAFSLIFGAIYNFSSLDMDIYPEEESIQRGDWELSREEIGSIQVHATPDPVNPFVGIGLGRVVPRGKVGALLELGVIYMGSPNIDLTATGAVEPTASQEDIIMENISDYSWYPVINLIISFKL